MSLSGEITALLMDMLEESGIAEIRRNDFAQSLGCVPSQINYVISSRFTPELGYMVESRRGGGGYIKISKISMDTPTAIMHTVNAAGDELDMLTCRSHLMNLASAGIIDNKTKNLILAATDDSSFRSIPFNLRDYVRASVFKNMLITYGKDD